MTNQEAFDHVWQHFIVEKNAASFSMQDCESNNDCWYRSPDGERCAFGVLIPDHLYDRDMEALTISDICREYPEVGKLVEDTHPRLLSELQSCHDYATSTQSFAFVIEHQLQRLAADWNLQIPFAV